MFVNWGLFVLPLCCMDRYALAVLCIVSTYVVRVFAFEGAAMYLTLCTCSRCVLAACVACICFSFRGFRFGVVYFFACNHSASPPGGNQVDGLPPA